MKVSTIMNYFEDYGVDREVVLRVGSTYYTIARIGPLGSDQMVITAEVTAPIENATVEPYTGDNAGIP